MQAHVYRPETERALVFVAVGEATPGVVTLTEAAYPGSYVAPTLLAQRVTLTELRQHNAWRIAP